MGNRTLAEIEKEITLTKEALVNVRGTETEVYARIVGYYRSVRNWNKGKRDEYNHRKVFESKNGSYVVSAADLTRRYEEENSIVKAAVYGQPVRYELFARATCPNCPPVKEYLSRVSIAGEVVDADTSAGASRAGDNGVFSAPTVILYDVNGAETARAHSVQELSAVFENTAVLC